MKIGDKVRIVKKPARYGVWVPGMDKTVGLTGVVYSMGSETIKVELENGRRFYYPLESVALDNFVDFLEKI